MFEEIFMLNIRNVLDVNANASHNTTESKPNTPAKETHEELKETAKQPESKQTNNQTNVKPNQITTPDKEKRETSIQNTQEENTVNLPKKTIENSKMQKSMSPDCNENTKNTESKIQTKTEEVLKCRRMIVCKMKNESIKTPKLDPRLMSKLAESSKNSEPIDRRLMSEPNCYLLNQVTGKRGPCSYVHSRLKFYFTRNTIRLENCLTIDTVL
ncbi:hypothetical protein DICVIV_07879 [Dictyocaulus viviparus]|uniref:Uncharacterized protein n=1 Tax=Dictyocaulus viviparus TaxID=29172 RepID=A0A0D8XQJ9_DICVI|nr:hypothetical protein DICVIV_07879 [Dictyocaulus viviparus]